jgi:hypothetical protein
MEGGEIKIRQERLEPIRQDLVATLDEVKAMIKARAEEQGGAR